MPNDFDRVLKLDGDGRIVPAGPCEVNDGEKVKRLYAWVVQANHDGTAAICSGFQEQFPVSQRWSARADAYHAGRFQKGRALAMAVMIVERPGHQESPDDPGVYWWSETIDLRPAE